MCNRKIIQCALSRQDHAVAREAYSKMSESGRDEPVTRYLMYKAGLQSGNTELGTGPGLIRTQEIADHDSRRVLRLHMSELR
jgi:hypothetical protein